MEKNEIRQRISAAVKKMSDLEKDEASKKICQEILSSKEYEDCDLVLSYMAMNNEVNPIEISKKCLADGKMLCLPRTESKGNGMNFYLIDSAVPLENQLDEGRWKILEPKEGCVPLYPEQIKDKKLLIVVPGVGFSKSGRRLGHGMGFYDIYISGLKKMAQTQNAGIVLFGVGFDCQLDEDIETVCEAHDIVMDRVFLS